MLLPTEKRKPITDPGQFAYLLFGGPGKGKTTFCSKLPNAFIADTEKGTKFLECHTSDVENWPQFKLLVTEFLKGDHKFKTFVVDTIGNLLTMCIDHIMKTKGVEHPADLPYGKGWTTIKDELWRTLNPLINSKYGLWLVAHLKEKTITSGGSEYQFSTVDFPDYIQALIIPRCDFIFQVFSKKGINPDTKQDEERSWIRTKNTKTNLGKTRLQIKHLPTEMELDTEKFLITLNDCLKGNK